MAEVGQAEAVERIGVVFGQEAAECGRAFVAVAFVARPVEFDAVHVRLDQTAVHHALQVGD